VQRHETLLCLSYDRKAWDWYLPLGPYDLQMETKQRLMALHYFLARCSPDDAGLHTPDLAAVHVFINSVRFIAKASPLIRLALEGDF